MQDNAARARRRAERARKIARWERVAKSWIRRPKDATAWALKMLGKGSLSVQGCRCCSLLRQNEGPRISERRRIDAAEAANY